MLCKALNFDHGILQPDRCRPFATDLNSLVITTAERIVGVHLSTRQREQLWLPPDHAGFGLDNSARDCSLQFLSSRLQIWPGAVQSLRDRGFDLESVFSIVLLVSLQTALFAGCEI